MWPAQSTPGNPTRRVDEHLGADTHGEAALLLERDANGLNDFVVVRLKHVLLKWINGACSLRGRSEREGLASVADIWMLSEEPQVMRTCGHSRCASLEATGGGKTASEPAD